MASIALEGDWVVVRVYKVVGVIVRENWLIVMRHVGLFVLLYEVVKVHPILFGWARSVIA